MIRINLLPIRAFKRRANMKMQVSVFGLSIVAVAVLLVIGYFSQAGQIGGLLDKKENLKTRFVEALEAEQILQIQTETMEVLNTRIDLIVKLIQQRSGPVRLLDEIINRTTRGEIWLTELSQQAESVQITVDAEIPDPKKPAKKARRKRQKLAGNKKDAIKEDITAKIATKKKAAVQTTPTIQTKILEMLTLRGVAKDNQSLAQYIERLNASGMLDKVSLVSTVQTIVASRRLKKFHIKAQVKYLPGVAEKKEAK